MKLTWRDGHRLQLLENGEAFFPAVFEAIGQAEHEIVIETFILFDDEVGRGLREALIAAARRGVSIDLTVDAYGSPDLDDAFVSGLTDVGVRMHFFDPQPRFFGVRTNLLRRLHRKIVAIDRRVAFVGGINYGRDQLAESGPEAKQDYSVRIEGPLADDIHQFALDALGPLPTPRRWARWRHRRGALRNPTPPADMPDVEGARVAFVSRDNRLHRDDIERCYRAAIRTAKREVLIANAYFFPGYRLLRDLRRAAKRGVKVQLILQGQPDMNYVRTAARMLYRSLVKDGVEIHEYCQRPLHGKVAVVDGEWSTVGSSNLDPLSLSLNLEANVLIHDKAFAADLRERLLQLAQHHCRAVSHDALPQRTMWRYLVGALAYHVVRGFPSWLARLPQHGPNLRSYERGRVFERRMGDEHGEIRVLSEDGVVAASPAASLLEPLRPGEMQPPKLAPTEGPR